MTTWRQVSMIEHDAQAARASFSYRAPANAVHDQAISIWSQMGPKHHAYSDVAVDLQTDAGVASGHTNRW